jgi:hypothetical protein
MGLIIKVFHVHLIVSTISSKRQKMTMTRIAVIGSTTVDKIVAQNLSFLKIGGVTTYSGITYARHGIDTVVTLKGELFLKLHGFSPGVFIQRKDYVRSRMLRSE